MAKSVKHLMTCSAHAFLSYVSSLRCGIRTQDCKVEKPALPSPKFWSSKTLTHFLDFEAISISVITLACLYFLFFRFISILIYRTFISQSLLVLILFYLLLFFSIHLFFTIPLSTPCKFLSIFLTQSFAFVYLLRMPLSVHLIFVLFRSFHFYLLYILLQLSPFFLFLFLSFSLREIRSRSLFFRIIFN